MRIISHEELLDLLVKQADECGSDPDRDLVLEEFLFSQDLPLGFQKGIELLATGSVTVEISGRKIEISLMVKEI